MSLQKNLLRFASISLVFVFVVIIAGSVVRITGSGMGCPDWPFCFGYVIPPTNVEPLTFAPGRDFKEGQMIIANDTLWVATHDFISADSFSKQDWTKYPKHDYAVFNATHTWIEYLNRLATGLLGFPVMILSVLTLLYAVRKKDYRPMLFALATVLMIGFEAWLGKLVVDGNLHENSITYHMLGTMGIIAALLGLIAYFRQKESRKDVASALVIAAFLLLALSFIQIVMGTQVREEVDIVARRNDLRSSWIDELPSIFKIHRSFAILVTLTAIALFYYSRKQVKKYSEVGWILIIVMIEAVSGVVLSYLGMPAFMQPVHLLSGMVLFALCLSLLWRWKWRMTA